MSLKKIIKLQKKSTERLKFKMKLKETIVLKNAHHPREKKRDIEKLQPKRIGIRYRVQKLATLVSEEPEQKVQSLISNIPKVNSPKKNT